MGVPTNIKTLLTGRVLEWARIEFKESWDAETSLTISCAMEGRNNGFDKIITAIENYG